jgi:hypothetical protein
MKRSLIVAINSYEYEDDLRGCLNDAELLSNLLITQYGFHDVSTLVENNATRERILHALTNLLAVDDDEIDPVRHFHFSGHGSRVMDRDNDEIIDQADEVLCLSDYRYSNPQSYIKDDDLREAFNIPSLNSGACRLYVTLDSCHSGTGTRSVGESWVKIEEEFEYDREVSLAASLADFKLGDEALARYAMGREASGDPSLQEQASNGTLNVAGVEPDNHLLFSGCSSAQKCKDAPINGGFYGAFTFAFVEILRSNPNISWRALHQQTLDNVKNYSQNPRLEGSEITKDRPVFS